MQSINNLSCPLVQISEFNNSGNVYFKRLDLLPFGGGNKVPRFLEFFKQKSKVGKIITISDPGSHTFYTLTQFLTTQHNATNTKSFTFLENKGNLNEYTLKRRNIYINLPEIQLIWASPIVHIIRFYYTKYFKKNFSTIGIGGQVKTKTNPYKPLFLETLNQLNGKLENKKVFHLFPISSGNMANNLLNTIKTQRLAHHYLACVTTGHNLSKPFLKLKYLFNKRVQLYPSQNMNFKEYTKLNTEFYNQSGFNLDPRHTIELLPLVKNLQDHEKDALFVVWVTCPLV